MKTRHLLHFILFLPGILLPATAAGAELSVHTSQLAYNFSLPDQHGKTHQLSDYKGKVILVNFWASWCLPCIREMPSMHQLAETLGEQDFQVLAINSSDSAKQIKEILKRLKVDMTALLDNDNKISRAWNSRVLPTSYLLDRNSQVRYRVVGVTNWNDADTLSKVRQLIESH